jgi:hypothetical protein
VIQTVIHLVPTGTNSINFNAQETWLPVWNLLEGFFIFIFFLRQALAMQLRLVLNLPSYCLHLPSAGITGVEHYTWLAGGVFKND